MNWKAPALSASLGALVTGLLLPNLPERMPPLSVTPDVTPDRAVPRISGPRFQSAEAAAAPAAPAFRWSQIESGDYAQYTANLRAVGCPEQTVRDILRADLAQTLKPGGGTMADPREFWQSAYLAAPRISSASTRVEAALDALAGPEPDPTPDLSFLPEAQAQAVSEWQERYDALEEALPETSSDMDDSETLSELSNRRDQELASILTPEQQEDYQLRHSYLANELRSDLVGFEVTEEEFRQLIRALQTEQSAAQEGRFESADDALRAVLGEERNARYLRAQDPTFRDLVQEAADAGHPYEDAVAVYCEVQAVRAAAGAGEGLAPDISAIGASIQARMGSDMRLLFLEFAGR